MTEHDWLLSRTDEDYQKVRAWVHFQKAAFARLLAGKPRKIVWAIRIQTRWQTGETVCKYGHAGNIYMSPRGVRGCRTCRHENVRRWRKRHRRLRRVA